MKTRQLKTDGYESGMSLAEAWQQDELIPAPDGEVTESYRLVHKPSVEALADEEGMQGPELSLVENFERNARSRGDQQDLERIKGWTDERVLELVEQMHQKRLNERFDSDRYPEMQGLAAFEDGEAKGIAAVYGTDYRKILLCQDQYRRLIHQKIRKDPIAEPGRCTTAVFKDSEVGPIVGRNMDSGIRLLPGLQAYGEPVLYRLPEEMGYSYLTGAMSMNEHQLVVHGSSIGYPNEPASAGFWVNLAGMILQYCKTVTEGLDMIERYAAMSPPSNMLLLDAEGDSVVVEKSINSYALRRTETPWIFTTDGIAVEEKTAAIQGNGTALHAFHASRHETLAQLLEAGSENRSVDSMSRIMRDHSDSPVCKHSDTVPDGYGLSTLYSFTLMPRIGAYDFWVTRPGSGSGPIFPCQQEATRHEFSFA